MAPLLSNRLYIMLIVVACLCRLLAAQAFKRPVTTLSVSHKAQLWTTCRRAALLQQHGTLLSIRGGDQEDEEEEEDDESTEVNVSDTLDSVLDVSKRVVILLGKAAVKTIEVASRMIFAAFESDDDEVQDGEEITLTTKVLGVVKRMWKALWSVSEKEKDGLARGDMEEEDDDGSDDDDNDKAKAVAPDFGRFLSKAYKVEATRDELDDVSPILGGTISDALRDARSQARLLVVLIPSHKPGKGGKDEDALRGFLSAEVATVAEKRARKKGETGSYVLWSAKSGSPEAVSAIKRLKATQTNSKGHKRPILLVVYPAQVMDRGMPKIVPRLLAQHHCSPPPSPEMMAAWLNALRKRHAKQYATMQHELREVQLYMERKEGYKESVVSDNERKERERKEEEERLKKEKAEEERQEAIRQRREQLKGSLPPEPSSNTAITIALRFADGKSSQRRFLPDTKLSTIFDWVDAMFEIEREIVILTTLNGQKTFKWEESDQTLSEASFARMTGLRVTTKS